MTTRYKPVRALDRGIDLLLALNRLGRARPGALAAATQIDRTTVYRLLQTLAARGLVVRSPGDDSWYLAGGVQRLSDGYIETDQVLRVAAIELGKLLPRVLWPSDFASFDQGCVRIQETNHRFSPLSVHRNVVGRRRSLAHSALGRAMLAAAAPAERATMLELARSLDGPSGLSDREIAYLVEEVANRGYAASIGESEPHISAIALPIRGRLGVAGAINIIFFRSTHTPAQIAERHLADLQDCATAIEREIAGATVV